MSIPACNIMDAISQAPQLQRFMIHNAHPTGRHLGTGSYGSVVELNIDGLVCAGKKIHEVLVQTYNVGYESIIVQKYVEECQLMSSLRHPHIVQFLGLCTLGDSSLPVLVMEMLLTSLDELLEKTPNIPISIKRSILEDVSMGLVYLHSRNPPIIHRDLSAKNVLLNSAMVAKISDLGNARIVNLHPGELAATLTRFPGTLVYMPPEASHTQYSSSVDIFSFGHLALYTIIQVFPRDLLPPTYTDPKYPDRVRALTEVDRRRQYVDQLHRQLGVEHPLSRLVIQCLHNSSAHRPPSWEVLQLLRGMNIPDQYNHLTKIEMVRRLEKLETEASMATQELHKLQTQLYTLQSGSHQSTGVLERQLREKDATITRLRNDMQALQSGFHQSIDVLEGQLREKDATITHLRNDMQALHSSGFHQSINVLERQLREKDATITHLRNDMETLQMEYSRMFRDLQARDLQARDLQAREAHLLHWESQLKQREAHQQTYFQHKEAEIQEQFQNLKLHQTQEAPVQKDLRREEADAIVREQQAIYQKIKERNTSHDMHAIPPSIPKASEPEQQTPVHQTPVHQAKPEDIKLQPGAILDWQKCTDLPVGMSNAQAVYLHNKLYVGGGETQDPTATRNVYVYNFNGNTWVSLCTPTRHPALTIYQSQLLLVGGQLASTDLITNQLWHLQEIAQQWRQPYPPMHTVRMGASAASCQHYLVVAGGKGVVLSPCDVEVFNGQQWMKVEPLPKGCVFMKPILHSGVFYLIGGQSQLKSVFYAAFKSLTDGAQQSAWKTLPDVPYNLCSGTVFQGALVAVGGIDSSTESDATAATSPLHMYSPATQTWDKVMEMPLAVDSTCTITLPTGEMMVIGGSRDNTCLPLVYKVISRN